MNEARHWFNPPVTVRPSKPGVRANINSVEWAAEELLKWTKRGPKWNHAVRVCMAALADQATPQEVRRSPVSSRSKAVTTISFGAFCCGNRLSDIEVLFPLAQEPVEVERRRWPHLSHLE